ncbi:MAG: hypothetical protein A3G75_14965 [Verrucomicrobia bacterium RIFCSPLOWO2_12_FULL_64_8]|nr:MAG: hypothetical protein A3G75_14965 [Verrucomicrobia bacterium RIFCSPLOWO2_12_FULL_64_8]
MLLSLALVAMLLVALNQFIFSMGELWGRGNDLRLFDRHVRNVTRFLDETLRTVVLPPAATGTTALTIQEVRPPEGTTDNLLTFELPAGSRVLPWPEAPLPDVVCSLAVKPGEGLVLYWHSRHEKHFADQSPRATVLSPLVTAMSYDYYNPGFRTWQNQTAPQHAADGRWQAPTRLRLRFAYGAATRETVVGLPVAAEGLPLF